MKDLHAQLSHAVDHAAQAREWLHAAHKEACQMPPQSSALASLAILPLLDEAVALQRKIARVADAMKECL